jgi:hypothetical protein
MHGLAHLSIPFVILLLRESSYFLCPPLQVADASPNTFYYRGVGRNIKKQPHTIPQPLYFTPNVPATFPCLTLSEPIVLCFMQL